MMVHGGCHAAWCWAGMQQWFARRGWRSSALDWFSHGASARLAHQEWLDRDVAAVRQEVGIVCEAVAEETGLAPVVVAHSMGGLAALAYATLDAPRLAALVLLAPVLPAGHVDAPVEVPVDPEEPWGPPPPEAARQLFYSGVDDADAELHFSRLQSESPAAVWQATRWTAELPTDELTVPALAFGAEQDMLVPPAGVQHLAESMGADYVLLPATGHGLTLDPVAEEVAGRSEEWLLALLG